MQMLPIQAVGGAALDVSVCVMWERGRTDLHQKRRKSGALVYCYYAKIQKGFGVTPPPHDLSVAALAQFCLTFAGFLIIHKFPLKKTAPCYTITKNVD